MTALALVALPMLASTTTAGAAVVSITSLASNDRRTTGGDRLARVRHLE